VQPLFLRQGRVAEAPETTQVFLALSLILSVTNPPTFSHPTRTIQRKKQIPRCAGDDGSLFFLLAWCFVNLLANYFGGQAKVGPS
jgi:hypothetical protein